MQKLAFKDPLRGTPPETSSKVAPVWPEPQDHTIHGDSLFRQHLHRLQGPLNMAVKPPPVAQEDDFALWHKQQHLIAHEQFTDLSRCDVPDWLAEPTNPCAIVSLPPRQYAGAELYDQSGTLRAASAR